MLLVLKQGEHPKHRGLSDPALLGTVERYFVEIMAIPRLAQRIHCFMFTRTFASTVQQVTWNPVESIIAAASCRTPTGVIRCGLNRPLKTLWEVCPDGYLPSDKVSSLQMF